MISTGNPILPTRNVSFGSVEVFEFEQRPGDHPDVRLGPPLALEATHCHAFTSSIADDDLPRNQVQRWTKEERWDILLKNYARSEIKESVIAAKKARQRREESIAKLSAKPNIVLIFIKKIFKSHHKSV